MKFIKRKKLVNDSANISNNLEVQDKEKFQKDSKDTNESFKKKRFLSNNKLFSKLDFRNNSLNKFKFLKKKGKNQLNITHSNSQRDNIS